MTDQRIMDVVLRKRYRNPVERVQIGKVALEEGLEVAMERFGLGKQAVRQMMREAKPAIALEDARAELARRAPQEPDEPHRRFDATEIVDGYIGQRLTDRSTSGSTSIWVTSLAKWPECPRQAVMQTTHRAVGAQRTVDGSRTMEKSTLEEELLRRVFAHQHVFLDAAGRQSRVKQPIEPFGLSGKLDFWYPEPDGRLLEQKCCSPTVWKRIVQLHEKDRSGRCLVEQDKAYIRSYYRQPQIYMWLTETREAALVLWNRDSLNAVQFDLVYDTEVVEQLQADCDVMRGHCIAVTQALAETQSLMHPDVMAELPQHLSLEHEPPCGMCDFRDVCGRQERWRITADVIDHPLLSAAVKTERRLDKWARRKGDATDFIKQEFKEIVAANAPEATQFTVETTDGVRIKGKLDARGAWRLIKRLPTDEENGGGSDGGD